MAHKTEGDCPLTVNAMIRKRAEMEKVSINRMIELTALETGVPKATISHWVWPKKKKSTIKSDSGTKPTKTHTKPETKIQIYEIAEEIKTGSVSDDDVKIIGDTIAGSIDKKILAPRVGTKVKTAVSKALKTKTKPLPKPIDNFDRLRKHIRSSIEGLMQWADGNMKPESREEAECAKAILAGAANHIIQYARLGIDVKGIYETFIEGYQNGNKKKNEYHRIRKIN